MKPSTVRMRREEVKLLQQDLATLTGIPRQTLSAIEAGRQPSLSVALRIAQALGATVEDLFGITDDQSWSVVVGTSTTAPTLRRVVANINDKWVAHSLAGREHTLAADGVATKTGGEITLFRPPAVVRENVIVMGCAPVLGVLCDRLNAERGPGRFVWLPRPSKAGADALADATTHIAGMHLTDAYGGEANSAHLKKARVDATLVTLARWEVGLVVAKGNPKRIRRAADVARRRVRLVNRERDASPRRVLERRLKTEGVAPPAPVATVTGHCELGRMIAAGAADVGPSVRDIAISYDLDFVPLQEERFDLAIPTAMLSTPEMRRLLDMLSSARARTELGALGYDVRHSGDRVL